VWVYDCDGRQYMENKKNNSVTNEKSLKRRKIIQDMLRSISFYENNKPVRKVKNNNLGINNKARKISAATMLHKSRKVDSLQNKNSEDKPFELSSDEKSALESIIRQLQNFGEDEMREITHDKKIESIKIVENKDSFLDFETEFDPVMLWKDTNLDDYSDLFTKAEIDMLKEKQKMFLTGQYVYDQNSNKGEVQELNILEDDFSDGLISEDDFSDELVSENDFSDELVSEDDFSDVLVSEDDFEDDI